jgi:hypothetical protein
VLTDLTIGGIIDDWKDESAIARIFPTEKPVKI